MSISQAQLDLTGSGPDSNGLEEVACPFHANDSIPMVLDHLRQAFLCVSCRVSGPFTIQRSAGKRIVVADVERYLPIPAALVKQPQAAPKLKNVTILTPAADLDRQSFHAAVNLLGEHPIYLVAFPRKVPVDFLSWLSVNRPLMQFWPVPGELLERRDSWAVLGAKNAVVSMGAKG